MCVVHGQNEVSYATVTRWMKKFKNGCVSINDAPNSGRPCSATSNTMVKKVCDVVKSDARLTVHQIASIVGISAASVFRIVKRHLKMRRITARWIPHLLSDTLLLV